MKLMDGIYTAQHDLLSFELEKAASRDGRTDGFNAEDTPGVSGGVVARRRARQAGDYAAGIRSIAW